MLESNSSLVNVISVCVYVCGGGGGGGLKTRQNLLILYQRFGAWRTEFSPVIYTNHFALENENEMTGMISIV